MVVVYSKSRDSEKKLSKNFTVAEFTCKASDKTLIDDELVVIMQRLRDRINMPIQITSGYRTTAYNESIGGSINSHHIQGMAVDFVTSYPYMIEIAMYLESIDVKSIILYTYDKTHFIHCGSNRVGAFKIEAVKGKPKTIATFLPQLKREYFIHTNKDEVYIAQKYLKIKGFYLKGAMDSKFGPMMAQAVKDFQRKNKLKIDGIIDKITWRELLK